MGQDSLRTVRCFSRYEHYLLEQAIEGDCWLTPLQGNDSLLHLYPLVVPARGHAIEVTPQNIALLCNTLLLHEGRRAEIRQDSLLYIDGRRATHCRFTQDYHWVEADNPTNPSDSRLFGFVPQSHLIGRASLIWFSSDKRRIGKRVK